MHFAQAFVYAARHSRMGVVDSIATQYDTDKSVQPSFQVVSITLHAVDCFDYCM